MVWCAKGWPGSVYLATARSAALAEETRGARMAIVELGVWRGEGRQP